MAIEGGSYYDRYQENQEQKVVDRFLSLRKEFVLSETDKSDELDAIENKLKEEGVDFKKREDIKEEGDKERRSNIGNQS